MSYSIQNFWQTRFHSIVAAPITPLPGWNGTLPIDEAYTSARLSLREEHSDLNQPVWLIAAPGAVGKSALAKQVCAATGAVYVDLASAAAVGGTYLAGGLVHSSLYQSWVNKTTAVVIDALDEARLRVTQAGFEAFIDDVAKVARQGGFPIVILGRVRIIEEAWLILSENCGVNPPIFDIELFSQEEAESFVFSQLKKLSKQKTSTGGLQYLALSALLVTHDSVYKAVINKVVQGIGSLSAQDGNRFVGYAPVLHAVAKVIASEDNVAKIDAQVERILNGRVLLNLTEEILARETGKLAAQVAQVNGPVSGPIYEQEEQLERLACRIYELTAPPPPAILKQNQIKVYEEAVQNLLPQHPFLDGGSYNPSSAVFAACIHAAALHSKRPELIDSAESYANDSQHTPNPFLYDFYREVSGHVSDIRAEHIGLLFESILARAKPDESVSLSIDEGDLAGTLSVEFMISRLDETHTRIEFVAPATGTIRLGRSIAGVFVDAPDTDLEIGGGDQLELIAPVSVNVRKLIFSCTQLAVKAEGPNSTSKLVALDSQEVWHAPSLQAPVIRSDAQLRVSWPGSAAYPWNHFNSTDSEDEDEGTADALRALRRFAMAFRSHSKGALARFKGKIEHTRMLKGKTGEALLAKLKADKIIYLKGEMYYLDPNLLGEIVGVSFMSVNLKQYSDSARNYVQGLAAQ